MFFKKKKKKDDSTVNFKNDYKVDIQEDCNNKTTLSSNILNHDSLSYARFRTNGDKFSLEEEIIDFILNIEVDGPSDLSKKEKGDRFEKFICNIFTVAGYYSYVTEKGSDGEEENFDVYAEKDNIVYNIECKAFNPLNRLTIDKETGQYEGYNEVGRPLVDKFAGYIGRAKESKEDNFYGLYVTTAYFSLPALKAYKDHEKIKLYDRRGLFLLISELVPDLLNEAFYRESLGDYNKEKFLCKECSAQKIEKFSPKHKRKFYGCSQFCSKIKSGEI